MPDSSSGNGIPAIRTFQFDSSSIGQISSAVNLFRGDVNIPQTLFTLPSRHSGRGLDVNLSIFYQSNVFQPAALRNLEAPTSVVGLGWDLPLTSIEATSTGSPDPDTRTYTLNDNGGSNTLIRQPQQPLLFTIPTSQANMLAAGQPLPAAILSQFLQLGLPLDAGAAVSGSSGSWTITDNVLEQCFVIQTSPSNTSVCNVCYGGQAFQLQDYSFWHIVYFPMFERWLIVTDDGIRKSFGGGVAQTADGYATSASNSIAWQVWWTLNGIPAWTGPSSLTTGQKQVAGAWYLVSASEPFGDAVTYQYNGWARNSSGLIADVEQQVAAGGLPYTKAVYLTQITDVFGRTVAAAYGDKLWSNSTDESPREYADPHRAVPSSDPNAYQDCYETKYLDNLVVSAANGTPVFSVQFGYNPSPQAQGGAQAVANVNNYTGPLQGDTFKRYLTSVVILNGEGASLPGFVYTYYLVPTVAGAQPGALASITFPQGGQASYTYQEQPLTKCNREATIQQPTPNAYPRVFYGDNYVVTLWFDSTLGTINLQVWSWYGRWVSWQPSGGAQLVNGEFDSTTINVLATSQFFSLTFDSGADSVAYIFNKAVGSPGQFIPATLDGTITGTNTPTVTYAGDAGITSYLSGSSFIAVSLMDPNANSWDYDVLVYSWVSQQWTRPTIPPATVYTYFAANNEYLISVDANGTVTLQYLNGLLEWTVSATLSILAAGDNPANIALTAGPGCAVLNYQIAQPPEATYQIVIVQWDANHTLSAGYSGTFTAYQDAQALTLQPVIAANSLVALNGILLRYSGGTWIPNTNLVVNPVVGSSPVQRYAYAADYALQVVVDQTDCTGSVLGYDPNADSTAWTTQPGNSPLSYLANTYDNFVSATDDYAVLGPNVYYRGTATDWTQLCSNPQQSFANAGSLSPGFDSQSLVNEGPSFFSYAVIPPGGSQTTVQSIVVKNAQVVKGQAYPFPNERMYTASLEQDFGVGMSPQGPNLFVTYPATDFSFDGASSINLRQYAGAAVDGALTHFPIYQLAVDDQYQDVSVTTYVPDATLAECDPTGLVIKYYQTTVYPGSDATTASYGKVVTTYLNGLGVQSGANYFDMLDGLLLATATYDQAGNLLESQANSWVVIDSVASDPVDGSAPLIPLFGGWVAQNGQTNVTDGLTTSQTTSFVPAGLSAPYTGRAATIKSQSYNGAGAAETWIKSYQYGPEVHPAMRALNMRSAMAQGTATQQVGTASALTVQSSASAFTMWPSSAGVGVSAPAQEASFRLLDAAVTAFPYSSYTTGSTPAGWLQDQRVLQRTARGQVSEQVDPCGTATSVIFSSDLAFPVAMMTNAPLGSAAYLGFEPYESTSGWTLTNTASKTTDVRTGTTSLSMPGGASAVVGVTVTHNSSAQNYVVGVWYKTYPGFQPGANAQCSVVCAGNTYSAPIAATNGEWTLATIGVPVSSGASTLQVTLTNGAAQEVLLDSVYVAPLPGSLLARTYDVDTQNYTSTMDSGGRTRWAYYDPFQRPSIQVGPNGCPKELAMRFLSRQGSSSDVFEPASPNAELTLHPADGGAMETFLDGSGWQSNWAPGGAADWQAADGVLTNTSAASATLTCQSALMPTWAVYFETTLPTASSSMAITAGNVSVTWSGSAYTCTAAGQSVTALATPPAMAVHWLLVAGDGIVLFFGDGQLLFSQAGSFAFAAPQITAGPGLGVTHLALLASPRVGVSYNDGSSRQRQVHQLYGADCRVSEQIYDPLDRVIATTRVAPGSFGSGASYAAMQYRGSFVDVSGFVSSFLNTGVMTGDIADYYAGQSENGVTRSDDQGYPYNGILWESSPRQCRVEQGLPGKPYAMVNLASTTPAQRATTQFAYGTYPGNTSPPANQYGMTSITSPIKTRAVSLQDQLGQCVAFWQLETPDATSPTCQSAGLRTYTQSGSGPQGTMAMTMPNALLPGPQSNAAAFVRTTISDGTGRAILAFDPNAGQTQFLYDPSGRVRFVQPALGVGEQWFLYNKYDALGRLLEQGTIPQAWNPQSLATRAADMSWPDVSVTRTVTYLYSYDGDGNTAAQIGQKTSCVTTTAGSQTACVTTETFTYDPTGRLTTVSMSISGAASATGATGYTYNNLGELLMLTQPAGSPAQEVFYVINDQGWITSVRASASVPALFASYIYTVEGVVETESLGGGSWVRSMQYLSPGWVDQVVATSEDATQSLSLGFTYNADSTISGRKIAYTFSALSGSLADTFTYDGQGRLSISAGSSDDQITSYDPNGNIWAVTQGGASQNFTCAPGQDQVAQTRVGGTTAPATYDARGRATAVLGKTLSYDNTTNLTALGSAAGSAVQLGYGGHGQRVLKITAGSSSSQSIYFCGGSQSPIARLAGGVWSAFVYGPTGLVAIVSDQTYYPLKDHQQSIWAVVNSTGLIARYVYLPFGATAADGPNPNVCAYRFMGQEWDAELSLYNFRDRMYDPILRRFLAPDTARQFPSPYSFCGNNPLNATDPSGDLSVWARVGIGLGIGLVLLAGIALSVVTVGAAAPAAAAADAAVIGAGAGAEAAVAGAGAAAGAAAGAEAGAGAAATGAAAGAEGGAAAAAAEGGAAAGAAAAEGGAAGASEVGAGAAAGGAEGGAAAAPAAATTSSWITAANFGIQVAAGTLQGAGASGLQYDIQHGRDFTAAGFFESVGWGAAGGALGAGLTQGATLGFGSMINGLGGLGKFAAVVAINGVSGAASSGVTAILANVSEHKAWYKGVLTATVLGFDESAVLGGLGDVVPSAIKDPLSIGVGEETINNLNDGVNSMVDRMQAFAKSTNGQGILIVGGFFTGVTILVGGLIGWIEGSKHQ